MARTLSEIYTLAKKTRDEYLELTEVTNGSKMSIMDAFTWVTSSCIWAFENVMDVFKVDLAADLQNRINGTPAYFANALLKYQSGDELVVNEEGTQFSYANIDETKRVVTKVSYSEVTEAGFYDKTLLLKIATGTTGEYGQIAYDELLKIRAYLGKLLFAGQHAMVVSRKGDILVPKVTVYHDGALSEKTLYTNIEKSLNDFIAGIPFDGAVYVQKIIDALQRVEHVVDVYIDAENTAQQGIFVAQFDDDNNLILSEDNEKLHKVSRYFVPNSGYIRQSAGTKVESDIPKWASAIVLKVEDK